MRMSIPIGYPYLFFLLFVRILAFLASAPFFSQRVVPTQAKIGLAFLLAFVLAPSSPTPFVPDSDMAFFAVLVQEILIGLLLGFVAMLPVLAVGLVGTLVAGAMGMSYASSISPLFPESTTPMSQLYTQLAILVFLLVRADHVLLIGLQRMVDLMPPGQFLSDVIGLSDGLLIDRILAFTSRLWEVSLQMALPVIGVVLLADLALVLISRAMPRMNVFSQSLPLKVAMGLIAIFLSLPYFWPQVAAEMDKTGQQMLMLFR
ncbi:MAG: flagellar biosynthetic protein FliR [Caldilineaceae bacterium]|nr:flagellar biosynthetic protein FliR [Caldilineaceae bacterium]